MTEISTKKRLLDAALSLIWENSYGSIGVDEICHRAGVQKGSFYHAYKSKSDLASAAFEHYWTQKQSRFDAAFSHDLAPLERLNRYCQLIIHDQRQMYKRSGKVLGCPFSSVGCELSTQDENIRHKACELRDRLLHYFESTVRDLLKQRVIAKADPVELAKEMYAYSTGVLTQAKIDNDMKTVERMAPGLGRLLGLKTLVAA